MEQMFFLDGVLNTRGQHVEQNEWESDRISNSFHVCPRHNLGKNIYSLFLSHLKKPSLQDLQIAQQGVDPTQKVHGSYAPVMGAKVHPGQNIPSLEKGAPKSKEESIPKKKSKEE